MDSTGLRFVRAPVPEWIGRAMTFDDLTTRILLYVIAYHEVHRRGPSYTQMTEYTGVSRETVHRRLLVLYDQGLVDWVWKGKGTLRPLVTALAVPPLRPCGLGAGRRSNRQC